MKVRHTESKCYPMESANHSNGGNGTHTSSCSEARAIERAEMERKVSANHSKGGNGTRTSRSESRGHEGRQWNACKKNRTCNLIKNVIF